MTQAPQNDLCSVKGSKIKGSIRENISKVAVRVRGVRCGTSSNVPPDLQQTSNERSTIASVLVVLLEHTLGTPSLKRSARKVPDSMGDTELLDTFQAGKLFGLGCLSGGVPTVDLRRDRLCGLGGGAG